MDDYRVVEARNPTSLKEEVQRFIKNGWKPIGGVAVCELYGKSQYLQALVKEKNDERMAR